MLCQPCQEFITKCLIATEPRIVTWVEHPYYHKSPQDLQNSTEQGCLICTSVTKSTKLRRNPFTGTTNFGSFSHTCHLIRILSAPDEGREYGQECCAMEIHELGNEVANLSAAAVSSPSTGSLATLSLAKHWLDVCIRDHTKCRIREDFSWYPTRLLDLSKDSVRLIETATATPSEPYATLSHCWGDEDIPVLTSENYDTFVSVGRPVSAFPRTHAEAIQAAKVMGFRYLWIDCYCIMQAGKSVDFASDKARELTLMKLVYANSTLNIGATSASAASTGCFSERDATTLGPQRVTLTRPGTNESQIYQIDITPTRTSPGKSQAQQIGLSQDMVDRNRLYREHKLFTRGWVLQERLLAPRMLHFAGPQIYWECSEIALCSDRLPFDIQERRDPESPFDLNAKIVPELTYKPGAWERIVMAYSQLELSYTFQDKFVALSGIAEHMAEALDDQYIAGLFKGRLLQQLCWYREEGGQRARRWRAPSWSWACIDGRVGFAGGLEETLATYVSSDIRPLLSNNHYGRLESASITLCGRMLEARGIDDNSTEHQIIEVACVRIHMRRTPQWLFGSGFDDETLCAGTSGSTNYLLPLVWCHNEREVPHLTAEEALEASEERLQQQEMFEMRGLFLERIDTKTFQRCGQFHASGMDEPLELLRMWASIPSSEVTIV